MIVFNQIYDLYQQNLLINHNLDDSTTIITAAINIIQNLTSISESPKASWTCLTMLFCWSWWLRFSYTTFSIFAYWIFVLDGPVFFNDCRSVSRWLMRISVYSLSCFKRADSISSSRIFFSFFATLSFVRSSSSAYPGANDCLNFSTYASNFVNDSRAACEFFLTDS
jgi:hypothetical protein